MKTSVNDVIKAAIADEHIAVTRAIGALLNSMNGICCILEVFSGKHLLRLLEPAPETPDIVLTDVEMKGMNGIEATVQVCLVSPDKCNSGSQAVMALKALRLGIGTPDNAGNGKISGEKGTATSSPMEDWDQLNTTVKPHTHIYNLMEELTVPATIRPVKGGYILPGGLTIQEAEQVSRNNVEDIYKKAFAKELPRYYEDERCTVEKNMIRANPDGSEDLVDFNWQDGTETFIQNLLPPGRKVCLPAA